MDDQASRPQLLRDADVPGAWAIMVDGTEQSWINPNDPTHLEFAYVQRIADAIDLHAPAGERLRVIHVGGAGMTLARYVAHTRASSAQIVLEPDAELTQQVRENIPLPRNSGIKVRAVDGRSGIAAMRDDYADVIIIDAFVGPRIPPELITVEFYREAARVLLADGTIMINITDRAPFDFARRVAASLITVFPHCSWSAEPATVKGRRSGNIVLLGSAVELPYEQLQQRAARRAFPYRMIHGSALTKLIAHAEPITDAQPMLSPVLDPGTLFFS